MLCLSRLYEEDKLSQKDLSDGFYLTKGAITKAVKKLEKNGLIKREKSDNDKRQYELTLTSKGKETIHVVEKINSKWEKIMELDNVSDEFYEEFTKLTFKSVELNKKLK